MNKRSRRRNRHKLKTYLAELDAIALARINQSFNACFSTWGGTRCPDCGLSVRPHWLGYPEVEIRADKTTSMYISWGLLPPCDRHKQCRGEKTDWMDKAASKEKYV